MPLGLPDAIRACLFDLDGVLTQTAKVHAAAWKQMFDEYLRMRAEREGEEFVPFDSRSDYDKYVDGKPRYDGVRSFLESRGVQLPEGSPDDPPSAETVCGLGNRKNELVQRLIEEQGAEVYGGSVRYVDACVEAGVRRAVVSSSANCRAVLESAGMLDRFEVIVDGNVLEERGLNGKPAPDTFLAAAEDLSVTAAEAAVFEDALSGVEAGRAGNFGIVVGVDRVGQAEALREHGADIVVEDLAELLGRMIRQRAYEVDPWTVREKALNLDLLAQSESVFALSNGHIGMRGNLDEGEPHGLPGTYLGGFFEIRPLPYAEGGYGYPESGQTVVNVTNGKLIRLLVGDSLFDVRYGQLPRHERTLDLRAGTLTREVEWITPTGHPIRIRTVRLVSFAQRAIAAIMFEVEPLGGSARVVLQSELVANEPLPSAGTDPRAAAVATPLRSEYTSGHDLSAVMVHTTAGSDLRLAVAMDHLVAEPDGVDTEIEAHTDFARATITCEAGPGKPLRVFKGLAYGWSSRRSMPAVRDQVEGALTGAQRTGWDAMLKAQRQFLDAFWSRADVEIGGDPRLQQALRFGMFHVLQAGARAEGRAIAAKGLTGSGYDGHSFWDTETFVLPMLTHAVPHAAAQALQWRHSTLPLAKERAAQLGLEGAAFPWRTIRGEECSGYWPAGTAAFHVNADIANAVGNYLNATGDEGFAESAGLELLVETAKLWMSLGHHDTEGAFRIDGVTGPDEYTAIADNNIYTNLAARRNLLDAADWTVRLPKLAHELGVDEEDAAAWRDAAKAMTIPYDEKLGVHQQSEGFTSHARWDFENTPAENYPLFLHYPYFDIYRKQVIKQADLVLAMGLFGDQFTDEQKARNFAYYEELTVRDSSLSACTQAVMAAEVGHLDLAYDYAVEAALMDLDDLEHNTRDGVHIASLAGAWIAVVAGFGGFRDYGGELLFSPRLPEALTSICFRVAEGEAVLEVTATHSEARYELIVGDEVPIQHYGKSLEVRAGEPVTEPIPAIQPGPPPSQPHGREPLELAEGD